MTGTADIIRTMWLRLLIATALLAIGAAACDDPPDTAPDPRSDPEPSSIQSGTRDHGTIRAELLGDGTAADLHDVRVSKIGANGAVEWSRRFGGDEDEGVASLQQTSEGGFILAGFTGSFGAGADDLWVFKLRPDGSTEWQKTFGGSDDDRARFVRQTRDLGFLVAGWSSSFVSGERDLWLLKLKPSGRVEWQTRYGRMGGACAAPFVETEDGGLLTGAASGGAACDVWNLSASSRATGAGPRLLAGAGSATLDPFQRVPFRKAVLPPEWSNSSEGRGELRPRDRFAGRFFLLLGCLGLMWLTLHADLGPGRMHAALAVFKSFSPYLIWPAIASFAIFAVSTVWRLVLWPFYRPAPPLDPRDSRLPALTVIVPAYNEGAAVAACIESIVGSDYPPERLALVVVDDGSTDDTFVHMQAAAAAAPGRVTLHRLPVNLGKRHAMHAGFLRAGSPVAVTVDSDTVLPPDALRALVTPLVRDPRVGAVAGRIEVLNRDENALTKMLGVRFRIGFDFQRAYQSILGSVLVCPGALTAYRLAAIRDGLDAWLHQSFLGCPCPTGDDHALTNTVLAGGWRTVYQANAVGLTRVPAAYRGLSRMYLRWSRSNVRESLLYFGFAHRLLGSGRSVAAFVDAAASLVQIPLRLYLIVFGCTLTAVYPALILRSLGMAIAASLLHAVIYLRSEKSLDVAYTLAYAVFSFFTLQWIYPWATVTVRQGRWLTR